MSIETIRKNLFDLGQSLNKHSEFLEEYQSLRVELNEFDIVVREVLTGHFQPRHYQSISAILNAIPTGNCSYILETWLDELLSLGLLTQEQVNAIKEGS